MHVVWHKHPGVQMVSLTIEMLERVAHERRNPGLIEPASAGAAVKSCLDSPSPFACHCSIRQPWHSIVELVDIVVREGIGESEGNELRGHPIVEMR